ncbi:hypothetical protein EGR_03930 [Echinococcus granulosus]|uniref:Uncharacterized protein n=1 Tax=Echinococcus granulosus TaxID=6210 RepID=W6UIF6_ECHGR|nr:hypothetical protein EGR_03930 [Echinococcus granulosus]EUB61255.1 hypothetical protein EGR_03930 [Echinococcus granulosus]
MTYLKPLESVVNQIDPGLKVSLNGMAVTEDHKKQVDIANTKQSDRASLFLRKKRAFVEQYDHKIEILNGAVSGSRKRNRYAVTKVKISQATILNVEAFTQVDLHNNHLLTSQRLERRSFLLLKKNLNIHICLPKAIPFKQLGGIQNFKRVKTGKIYQKTNRSLQVMKGKSNKTHQIHGYHRNRKSIVLVLRSSKWRMNSLLLKNRDQMPSMEEQVKGLKIVFIDYFIENRFSWLNFAFYEEHFKRKNDEEETLS